MANLPIFATGEYAKIQPAIDANVLSYPSYVYVSDKKQLAFIDKDLNINLIVGDNKSQVVRVDALPAVEEGDVEVLYIYNDIVYVFNGTEYKPMYTDVTADFDALQAEIDGLKERMTAVEEAIAAIDESDEHALAVCEKVKYEITSAPVGTLVDYREKEIRVMCPADTQWVKQNVGTNGLANRYYITFKAYAPEGAVSFKEDAKPVIEDQTMLYFENNSSAGIDEYGRKYSVVWWSVAEYDEATDVWTYFGAESTTDNYIGKDYSVEWYDADGVVIASDYIRINLTNENCHSAIEPFYIGSAIDAKIENVTVESRKYTDEQIALLKEMLTIIEL